MTKGRLGDKGCMQFSISASLNAADAIELLHISAINEVMSKLHAYAGW